MTSCLMKDMNSKTDMYRANAIRVLCRITDGTLLTQIERYLKQAIVDKNPVVASSALVSGIHLLQVLIFQTQGYASMSNFFYHFLLHFFFATSNGRQIQKLSSGGVMRSRKLFSQGQHLFNFMLLPYFIKYVRSSSCVRFWVLC